MFKRVPKTQVRLASRRKIVATVGDQSARKFNFGALVARIALTGLIVEMAFLMSPPVVDLTRWIELPIAPVPAVAPVDPSCTLREWTGNEAVDPHWQDIRRWCSSIMQASQNHGIDPYLITAVMLMESGGQPEVISRSGAVGLMQVMPRDGIAADFQCPAGPCFANRPSIDELKNPAFNIDYGVGLLAANNTRTGSMREALRSYGPYNVGYTYADRVLRLYETIKGS
jgi:soluble lytic murein transglycosylase-like protein